MWPRWFSDIHNKPSSHFLAAFSFVSFLYGKVVLARIFLYKQGVLKRRKVPGAVISVGNITTGGTGKTPAVIMLARWAADNGFRVVVLSRGYGGKRRKNLLLVSDTENILSCAEEAGDEAFLIARRLPGVPVLVSKQRHLAAMAAAARWSADLFILDDGFQHVQLERQADIVLLDAGMPFGNGRLLPLGPLREPISQLRRADALILTRSENDSGPDPRLSIKEDFPGLSVFRAAHIPEKVVFPRNGEDRPIEFLAGKRVMAFAGIGRPEAFLKTLKSLGADVVDFLAFGDHHNYGSADIGRISDIARSRSVAFIVTTEKDWVRIGNLAGGLEAICYVSIQFKILGDEDAFFSVIKRLITEQRDREGMTVRKKKSEKHF